MRACLFPVSQIDDRCQRDRIPVMDVQKDATMPAYMPRLIALVVAAALGSFLVGRGRLARTNYWVLKDGQPAKGVVIKDAPSGHNRVIYRYQVNEKEYTAKSRRS